MIAVLAFCDKDGELAAKNAQWMSQLDDYKNHTLLLCYSQRAKATGIQDQIRDILVNKFGAVLPDYVPYDEDERQWPYAPNHLFRRVAFHIQENVKAPWLFMEADSCPLKKGWLDEIDLEYKSCGKPFMGDGVSIKKTLTHMSGVAVYPADTINLAPNINAAESTAWDLYAAPQIMPKAYFTKKIQHTFWLEEGRMPTFPDQESVSIIRPESVIFHRCKDGTLIDRLMEKQWLKPTSGTTSGTTPNAPKVHGDVQSEIPKTIHTYYHPVPEISTVDSGKLIDLWADAWKQRGWNPVVLGDEDARKNPLYNAARMVFEKFPTINPRGYEMSCWMRWLAMANVGGYMSDFDLFPNDTDKFTVSKKHHDCPAFFYSGNDRDKMIPCFVKATKEEYQNIVVRFLSLSPKGKHYSDMMACGELFGNYDPDKKVLEYGDKGWESAGAIHFSHHSMGDKKPKWKHIPEILKQIKVKIETVTTSAQPPQTLADQMRSHIAELEKIIGGKQGRLISFQTELRKRKLIPQARKR